MVYLSYGSTKGIMDSSLWCLSRLHTTFIYFVASVFDDFDPSGEVARRC